MLLPIPWIAIKLKGGRFAGGGQDAGKRSMHSTYRIVATPLKCFQKILKKTQLLWKKLEHASFIPKFSKFS